MKIYRYEKEDGGGPWCTLDGHFRARPDWEPSNTTEIHGCPSLEELHEYFTGYKNGLIWDCKLKVYEVPENEVHVYEDNPRAVTFPRKYLDNLCNL